MFDYEKFQHELKEEVDHLMLCGLHPWQIANKVVEMICEHDARKVNIFELFSRDIVEEKILEPGELMIKAGMIESKVNALAVSSKNGLQEVDQSHLIKMYEKVFREWESMGWIKIAVDMNRKPIDVKITIVGEA